MNSINSIKNEVQHFQAAVKRLGSDIKESGLNWSDEKYKTLSKKISKIATNTKEVIISADNLYNDFKKFESIASQK